MFQTERGRCRASFTGPASGWPMSVLDLSRRGKDVRAFVAALEAWVIGALAGLGVAGEIRPGRVGVWVARGGTRRARTRSPPSG